MSQWTKSKFKQRGPPPALFGQSSAAASSVSLAGDAAGTGGPSAQGAGPLPTLSRTASRFRPDSGPSGTLNSADPAGLSLSGMSGMSGMSGGTTAGASTNAAAAAFSLPLPMSPSRHVPSTRATDRTDALWAEMQATLEEVELSASDGTRVFGPDHDHKLAALREAQIALAQAWARSEADEQEDEPANNNLLKATTATSVSAQEESSVNRAATGDESAADRDRDNNGNASVTGTGRPLEQETQVDIMLARKRREANDRYFQRVNQGVLDVVAKLEDVAGAMRAVEQESVDIWGGSASGGGGDNESEPRRAGLV